MPINSKIAGGDLKRDRTGKCCSDVKGKQNTSIPGDGLFELYPESVL